MPENMVELDAVKPLLQLADFIAVGDYLVTSA
jgi:hypothetical protein